MASYTPNYNLKKPADADSYDIADANGNMDIIDGALNTLNSNLMDFETVTDWNAFKPTNSSKASKRQGISIGNGASNSPFSGDNATFYGHVEGYPDYCTQHLTVQYSATASNRNRTFVRSYLGSAWTTWVELARQSDITSLDSKTTLLNNYTVKYGGTYVDPAHTTATIQLSSDYTLNSISATLYITKYGAGSGVDLYRLAVTSSAPNRFFRITNNLSTIALANVAFDTSTKKITLTVSGSNTQYVEYYLEITGAI